jgi:hypothetical protein
MQPAMMAKTTPAAAPTPALNAVLCVTGVEVSRICWFVGLAVLEEPVPVAGATLVVEPDLAEVNVEMLEDWELDGEYEDDIGLADVDGSVDTVTATEELCVAEFDSAILVYWSPTTPMIVCAVPSET